MKNNTIWTVSEAYQDATYGSEDEIYVGSWCFQKKNDARDKLWSLVRTRVEEHYDGNDDWTETDLNNLVNEIFDNGKVYCGTLNLKWINDYEHLAWSLQGHNV